jgi:hypothetical protein
MRAASIGQYGNLDFVFLDLKHHTGVLDKQITNDLKQLEKLIRSTLTSRKKLETELHLIFPRLFDLRIKAMEWLSENQTNVNQVLDEVYPSIEVLGQNPRLKKTGFSISQALLYNRKLVSFFSESGVINENTFQSVSTSNFDYSSFIVALQLMPPQINRLIGGLMNASLQIEFISIAAIMIHNEEATCSDVKIAQLTSLASTASSQYMGYVNHLITMGKTELFTNDKEDWNTISTKLYANAYGDDEPDYDNYVLREPNPDYNK